MTATADTVAGFEGRFAKVQGPARSGKTEALIRRVTHLIESGQDPASILVAVASRFAAQAFRQRLQAALPANKAYRADDVAVKTPIAACVDVLDTPAAREATGRIPRLLTTAEYNFLLEDLKALGDPSRKLRTSLSFLWRQMTTDQPEEKWQIQAEDRVLLQHIRRNLKLRGAMLDQEVGATTIAYLTSAPEEAEHVGFAYVLADDFAGFSAAEQRCLSLLAKTQLIACGNPNEVQQGNAGHTNVQGFLRFENEHEGTQVFELAGAFGNANVVAFCDALCDHEGLYDTYKAGSSRDCTPGVGAFTHPTGVQSIKWGSSDDETKGLATYVRALADANEGLHEHRIGVVVPNRRWESAAATALRRRGFTVSTAGAFPGVAGDPRDARRCLAMTAYTRLNLLADPHDMVAWRTWCGIDDRFLNSNAWSGLQDYAEEQDVSLYEALESLGTAGFGAREPFDRAHLLAERWRMAQDFLQKNESRKGFGLLKAIGAQGLSEFDALASAMTGMETAKELYRMMRDSLIDPEWPDDVHTVHVTSLKSLAGTEYDALIVMGAVDGMIPNRNAFEMNAEDEQRNYVKNAERRLFVSGVAKANQLLVLSHFTVTPLDVAEKTRMQIARAKLEQGRRMAMVRPCCFIAEAGAAAPATIGGQQLLSEQGLL